MSLTTPKLSLCRLGAPLYTKGEQFGGGAAHGLHRDGQIIGAVDPHQLGEALGRDFGIVRPAHFLGHQADKAAARRCGRIAFDLGIEFRKARDIALGWPIEPGSASGRCERPSRQRWPTIPIGA
jgi:hypothetical protein